MAGDTDVRRTYASWLKQAGIDSAVVAKLLGHSSTRMVDMVYGQLADVTLQQAVKALPDVTQAKPSRGDLRSKCVAALSPSTQHKGRMRRTTRRPEATPNLGVSPTGRNR